MESTAYNGNASHILQGCFKCSKYNNSRTKHGKTMRVLYMLRDIIYMFDMYGNPCAKCRYQGQGQVIIPHSICEMQLLAPALDTCIYHTNHDDVMKHFPHNWPFVRGIHRSPVNSPHKGQWRGALMFSLICDWVNSREAGDLRRYCAHYDVIVMCWYVCICMKTHRSSIAHSQRGDGGGYLQCVIHKRIAWNTGKRVELFVVSRPLHLMPTSVTICASLSRW